MALKSRIANLKLDLNLDLDLLAGLVQPKDIVLLVCPIDESAPKGRMILPQQQVIRACLDVHASPIVAQVSEVTEILQSVPGIKLVITDSQAFGAVKVAIGRAGAPRTPPKLTSFSILFARQKGDLAEFVRGAAAIKSLNEGDLVVISEGCTHHRQCNDIGAVKIPKFLEKLTGKHFTYQWTSGTTFNPLSTSTSTSTSPKLIIHCGGCMLTRREVLRRIEIAKSANIPIINYGVFLALAQGVDLDAALV